MNNFIDLKIFAISLSTCAVIAFIASSFFEFGFVPVLAIVVFALLVNGLVAAWEDESPRGFNDPEDKDEN